MTPTIAPNLIDAAAAVRTAVAIAFADHDAELVANDAVASASPVVACAEGLRALWAVATALDADGIDALASAAHYVAQGGFWGRSGEAAAILTALALADAAGDITGGPDPDPRFVAPV
jgi:hypothetical protein